MPAHAARGMRRGLDLASALLVSVALVAPPIAAPAAPAGLVEILAASPEADWRTVDPEDTLYLTLPQGRVVIELAPAFAPGHVANIKRLARAGFYDGLFVVRVQDNYVVQWGDANAARPTGGGRLRLEAEFDRPYGAAESFVPLPDPDIYAPVTGFAGDFPAARDPVSHLTWLTHCYGMVGAGRDNNADSGGGPELYAVIGQAPRQLDRNVTLVGRVIDGMEALSALPRGHGEIGFYQKPEERIPILSLEVAADRPAARRTPFQVLKTDSPTFAAVVQNRRFRRDSWFKVAAGHIDVCNLPLPVRVGPR
ncbi:MAG: peptidylprolyl isomerase [Caulobacteraceae bacterium]|nr:peptidylprolyl isomerase [Caulobacteraceae bacterium]